MSDKRVFHYALAASLALHAALLLAFPDLVNTARRAASIPPRIIARLMEPEPPPPPAAPVEKPRPATPKKTPEPRVEREVAVEKPAPRIEAPAPPAPSVPVELPAPVAAIEPQPAPPTVPAPRASTPQPAPEALSRDQYRVQLIDEASRYKRYPPLARENNWQGDVRVAVAIGTDGRPTVTLRASSGYEVLDRQALEMFTQAARAVPVPPALRGREFALEVRAVYGLED